jgi:hypothetical protein
MKSIVFAISLLFIFSMQIANAQNNPPDSINQTQEIKPKPVYGGDIGLGCRILTGNMSKHFTNDICGFLSAEGHFNRFIISVNTDDATGSARRDIEFTDTTYWTKGMTVWQRTGSVNFGIFPVDTKRIKVATTLGIMMNTISAKFKYSKRDVRYEPLQYGIRIGSFIDFKGSGKSKWAKTFKSNEYRAIRLSIGACFPLNSTVYPEIYNGNTIYFSIGYTQLFQGKEKKERKNFFKQVEDNLHLYEQLKD